MNEFAKNTGISLVIILGLLGVDRLQGVIENSNGLGRITSSSAFFRYLVKVPGEMHNGQLNAEDFDALAAGYYEGLRKDAGPVGLPEERDDVRFRDDFLRYEFKPYVKRRYPAGMRITNSLGMQNPEYGYDKPPHTRRIALFGDSVALGPYGMDYEALLENRLNEKQLVPGIEKYQILNFAVNGYSVLQMMDVALEKAPKFHPDVYVVALTQLELLGKAGWRTHIGRLVVSGTDLKYGFLRDIASKAGVQPTDHLPVIRLKLAPFFQPVTTWALEQIRDRAATDGARMIILLVPPPVDPQLIASDFDLLHGAVDPIGVPTIDLRDTFRSVSLEQFQVVPKLDIHPNAGGHKMIFENLYARLQSQQDAWSALIGR